MQIIGAAVAAYLALPIVAAKAASDLNRISHIIILYLENHSYDNLLGAFPGANGLARAGQATLQRDQAGIPYLLLPDVKGPFDVDGVSADVRAIALGPLPNQPFATLATTTRGLTHLFYTNRAQIHGGANDRFALLSDAGGLSMGYYSAAAMEDTNLWKAARTGVLFDNFFQGAFGGSFLNHMWLVCACGPLWPNPPEDQRSMLDANSIPISEQRVTTAEDGDYAVNTTQSVFLNNGRQGVNLPRSSSG
jgi:phospholipase C